MLSAKVKYSLLLPAFNEERTLSFIINKCQELLNYRKDLEIVIIDNGSSDNSRLILERSISPSNSHRLRFLIKKKNEGYGAGLRFGIANTQGPIIIWTHADLQCDLWDVVKVIESYEANSSRRFTAVKGKRLNRPFSDTLISGTFSLINRIVNGAYLKDINAQPNLIPRELINDLLELPNNSTFELFVLTHALKRGYAISRVGVQFPKRNFGVGSNQGFVRKINYSLTCLQVILEIRKTRVNNKT